MKIHHAHKLHFLKTHSPRRCAMYLALFGLWLALVILLPKKPSDIVGMLGLYYGMSKWMQWGYDPKAEPSWGCFILLKSRSLSKEIEKELKKIQEWERSLTPEQKALLESKMLLRAAEAESQPAQELLRPATDAGKENPAEMLRSSENPDASGKE